MFAMGSAVSILVGQRLGAGDWKIFGSHGMMKEYRVQTIVTISGTKPASAGSSNDT